jgi:hypothetical protein
MTSEACKILRHRVVISTSSRRLVDISPPRPLAAALGLDSPQAAQQRARRLGAAVTPDPGETELDSFGYDIAKRCRWARRHNDGHPSGAWSTGEQLATALVLGDHEHLAAMDYTPEQAARSVQGRMMDRPADINAWLSAVRAAASFEVGE